MSGKWYPGFSCLEKASRFRMRCELGLEGYGHLLNPPSPTEYRQSVEEAHVEWIIQWFKQELPAQEILEPDASGWTAQSHVISDSRQFIKGLSADLDRAKSAFKILEECFKDNKRFRVNYREDKILYDDPMFERSFGWIQGQLEIVGKWIEDGDTKTSRGNFPNNRALCILEIWEALEPDVSMRAAARIMAEAFERVGMESGEDKKRRGSIYQTIRNASR